MASISRIKNKGNARVFEIRVFRGRDPITGKQEFYRKRVSYQDTYSEQKARKLAEKEAVLFEADCAAGKVLTKREQQQAVIDEQITMAAQLTFDQYAEIFMDMIRGTSAQRTIENYELCFRKASPTFGKVHMTDIKRLMIKEFFVNYQRNGVNMVTGKKGVSSSTVHCLWTALHHFFATAVEDEVIPYSPMASLQLPKARQEAGTLDQMKCLSLNELQRFMRCLSEEDLMWQAYYLFMVDTGCRRGEATALEWSDVDFLTGEVTISKNAQYSSELGEYTNPPKSGKSRKVLISENAQAVLMKWKQEQDDRLKKAGLEPSKYCFTNAYGDRIRAQRPYEFFVNFRKKYNFPGCHPHTLRHTLATLALANGADVVNVAAMLGHSSPTITLTTYAHAHEEAQKRNRAITTQALYGVESIPDATCIEDGQ